MPWSATMSIADETWPPCRANCLRTCCGCLSHRSEKERTEWDALGSIYFIGNMQHRVLTKILTVL